MKRIISSFAILLLFATFGCTTISKTYNENNIKEIISYIDIGLENWNQYFQWKENYLGDEKYLTFELKEPEKYYLSSNNPIIVKVCFAKRDYKMEYLQDDGTYDSTTGQWMNWLWNYNEDITFNFDYIANKNEYGFNFYLKQGMFGKNSNGDYSVYAYSSYPILDVVNIKGGLYRVDYDNFHWKKTEDDFSGHSINELGRHIQISDANKHQYRLFENGIVEKDGKQIDIAQFLSEIIPNDDDTIIAKEQNILSKSDMEKFVSVIDININNVNDFFYWNKMRDEDGNEFFTLLLKDDKINAFKIEGKDSSLQVAYTSNADLYVDGKYISSSKSGSDIFGMLQRYNYDLNAVTSNVIIDARYETEYNNKKYSHLFSDPKIKAVEGTICEINIPNEYWIDTVDSICGVEPNALGKHIEILDDNFNTRIYLFENGYKYYENADTIYKNIVFAQEYLYFAGLSGVK